MRASVVARALTIAGVDHVTWLARDAHDAPREGILASTSHGELRFRPAGIGAGAPLGRSLQDPRGVQWSVEGPLAAIGGSCARGTAVDARLPGRARARVGGAHVPVLGRGAAVGGARIRVRRLGTPGACRRWQPRLAARVGLTRRADRLRREMPEQEPAQWAIRDVAGSCSHISAWPTSGARARAGACAGALLDNRERERLGGRAQPPSLADQRTL